MVSFQARQTLKIAAGISWLALLAAPGFSQPAAEALTNDEQRQLVERIQEERARNGQYSEGLIEPLTTLGLLYQEGGDHDLAAATLEQTLQVVRANYGLHSLDQAPLIRQAIRNETARGNDAAAWDLEQELLSLARRNSDDLRTVRILREIADERMALLRRFDAGEFPPQVILGCFYGGDIGSCTSGSRSVASRSILSEARRHYASAIGVMLRHELYSSDELRELEMDLLRSAYADQPAYRLGRQSLRRLLSYDVANSEPWLKRADALLQVADWDLLFSHNGLALETYEHVYRQLGESELAQASVERFFTPETPVVLPAFLPNPLASDETPDSTGHIDVAFEITKYGQGRRIEILDTTTNAPDAATTRLVRLIKSSRFRPRVTGGELDQTSPVVMRYYLNE